MDNQTQRIDRFLQNEMSAEERESFLAETKADGQLKEEFQQQVKITQAAFDAGLKQQFGLAYRKYFWSRHASRAVFAVAIALVIILVGILPAKRVEKTTVSNKAMRVVNPPLAAADKPFTIYEIDAGIGGTAFYPSGSAIVFPPHSFINKNGSLISGKVTVKYRELRDPLDFFVSGIPMNYDSAGVKYLFASDGMCEILAFQEHQPVFVNQKAKPQIFLSSTINEETYNLYYLDTILGAWQFKGKDTLVNLQEERQNTIPSIKTATAIEKHSTLAMVKPVMPARADDDKQSFSIEIEPGSFEELNTYNGLKLQVVDDATYNAADAQEHWDDMKLEHSDKEGIYKITFINSRRTVSYIVKPVLEGNSYEEALKVYKAKMEEYKRRTAIRLAQEKEYSDSIEALNVLQKKGADTQKRIQKEFNDMVRQLLAQRKNYQADTARQSDAIRQNEVIRSFSLNRFGVWNCDHPEFPDQELPITAVFKDTEGKTLPLSQVAVVYKDFNGITNFYVPNIRVIPGKENVLWAIHQNSFYFTSAMEFKKMNIASANGQHVFQMEKIKAEIKSYDDVKRLVPAF